MQRFTGVQNVLHDEDVAAGDIGIQILGDVNDAGGGSAAAIAGNRHEIDIDLTVDLTHQVGNKDDGAVEDADDKQILALVVFGDLLAQALADAL